MAHWQGFVRGNRGDTSRLGSKKSGMEAYVASWSGRCEVDGYVNGEGIDCVRVTLTQHHNAGAFPSILLYDGPIVGTPELANAERVAELAGIREN